MRDFLAKIRNGRELHPDEDLIDVLLDLYNYYFDNDERRESSSA